MRSAFYYNNWLYTVVGYLVEIFGGKTFEEQVIFSMDNHPSSVLAVGSHSDKVIMMIIQLIDI